MGNDRIFPAAHPPEPLTVPNRSVLVVGEPSNPVDGGVSAVARRFELCTARDREEALGLVSQEGPFAVVLAGGNGRTAEGASFLREIRERCPDTIRILVSPESNLGSAMAAVHEGGVFRFLRAPVSEEALLEAIEEAVERFQRIEDERLLITQLQFSRESLLDFAETLERRLAEQTRRLAVLEGFTRALGECDALDEIAALAAGVASSLLGSRSARVTFSQPGADTEVAMHAGGEIAEVAHHEPIRTDEGEIGSLVLGPGDAGSRLSEEERRVLTAIASQTAIAASAANHRRARDLAHHGTILALARLAESRDDETGKHLERVSAYCCFIAEGLREDGHHLDAITPFFLKNIVLSAPLHDIGKVGIPDSILLKPGPLSEEEWVIMRRHPTIGAETLQHVLEASGEQPYLRMGLEIAWCHHERWDGKGYPRGLQGAEIPLSARIMALADCYDALTRRRPYKEAWSHAEALAYILEQRGKQFDADVVDSFLKRSERAEEVCRRLTDPEGPSKGVFVAGARRRPSH